MKQSKNEKRRKSEHNEPFAEFKAAKKRYPSPSIARFSSSALNIDDAEK
jgi:hypothetical protein